MRHPIRSETDAFYAANRDRKWTAADDARSRRHLLLRPLRRARVRRGEAGSRAGEQGG